jgi:citrate lyase subunit beta/citryl-CoA lyase
MIAAATRSEADLVFLDLEDAVAPAAKDAARANVAAALCDLDWGTKIRACRINGVGTPWFLNDLTHVVGEAGQHLDIVIVPKVKTPRNVWLVDDLISDLELRSGLEPGAIGLEILIEETEALSRVDEIAACSPRIEALILGVGDLAASQGMRAGHIGGASPSNGLQPYPGDIWHYARNRLIVAARANGIDAIDGPYAEYQNHAGYQQEACWATTLGAVGKWCIHPDQVPLAKRAFSPTPEEVDHAQEMIAAMRKAVESGLGAANVNGAMVDAVTVRMYEAVISRAERCGVL